MKKFLTIAIATIALGVVVPQTTQAKMNQNGVWSFSSWLSEGFQNIMDRMEQEVAKLKKEFSLFGPKAETRYDEKAKKYSVSIQLPGYKLEDITVKTEEQDKAHVLIIDAKKKVNEIKVQTKADEKVKAQKAESAKFHWQESLPKNAIVEKIAATYEAGILKIEIPVEDKEPQKTNVIKVIKK